VAWIELHQAVWTHRKTFELAALLGIDETYAAAHVIRLWSWALDNAPDGDLGRLSDRAIAFGAGWRHEVSLFVASLVKAGWLDDDRAIHDWAKYAGRLIERREKDAERKRESRGPAPDVRRTSNGTAAGVRRTGPDLTGPDLTGPDTTIPTPQPPPRCAGEGEAMNPGRRRRRGVGGETPAPTSPPSEVTLLPPTEEDRQLWNLARGAAATDMTPTNAALLAQLAPVGRAAETGGLLLRAPPEAGDLGRFAGVLRVALRDAGDDRASAARILAT
jgi:hypothetical protein